MRPEFLNRIDEQVMFLPLTRQEIHQIMELLLRKVKKMLDKQGIAMHMSEPAKDLLSGLGYDPQFGARPMKRVLQKEVTNELSKMVLSGEFGPGDTIYIATDPKGLTFSKEPFEGAIKEPKESKESEELKETKKPKEVKASKETKETPPTQAAAPPADKE